MESSSLSIDTIGVSTARYRSKIFIEGGKILTPIGPNLLLYCLNDCSKIQIKASLSAITVLLENDHFFICISYSGEIIFFDKINFKKMKSFIMDQKIIRHASVTNDYLLVNAEDGEEKGLTQLWNIKDILNNETNKTLLNLRGRYRFGEICKNNSIFILKKNMIEKIEKKKIYNFSAELYTPLNNYDSSIKNITIKGCRILSTAVCNERKLICINYSDRNLVIINSEKMEIFINLKFSGVGSFLSACFGDDNHIYLSPKSNYLLKIKCEKNFEMETEIPIEEYENDYFSIKCVNSSALQKDNFYLAVLHKHNCIISSNSYGLNYFDIKTQKTKNFFIANITFCGLAQNLEGNLFAVGDLAGSVQIFSLNQPIDQSPVYSTFVESSIRSLAWLDEKEAVLIGGLDGSLFEWKYSELTTPSIFVLNLNGGITSLKINGDLIMASTTSGIIYFLSRNYEIKYEFTAHHPQTDHDKENFGSLGKFAEIWSITFSPSGELFATCSEDQSCCIWETDLSSHNQITLLKGHEKAVTSIDWQKMHPDLGEIFISCSDDQTFRIYSVQNKKDFSLKEIVSTSFIKEWHTLTYLALEKNGKRVLITAQCGYVFIYNILERKFEYKERVSMGSCEGVSWGEKHVLVCSADLTVNCITLK